ncbi:MAG: hypothetical protein ABJO36_02680 [Litorimonas sp.]
MSPKFRKYLILAHLWLAGLMAPAFALHAISGGLYLMNIKGNVATERVSLPSGSELDFESVTLETDVRSLLENANLKSDFEYIRNRGTVIQLRPTSRTYLEFRQTPQGLSATRVKPDTVKSLMELHMGHGPQLFKSYQKLVALLLLGVVLGGILVGLMAKAYRRQTVIALVLGTVVFVWLGFF